jgi:hypothetical protein
MRPRCTSAIKLSLMQFSRGRRGLLQDRLKDVSVKSHISARLDFCCRERLYSLGNKSWRVVVEPSQESVQNRMFLPSPTLNPTFACKRLDMFCVEKIVETMPCQVGDKEHVNSGIPLIKRGRYFRRMCSCQPPNVVRILHRGSRYIRWVNSHVG